MAELFSKEYLKELLKSDSLTDAAATTAKAGFESVAKKVTAGEDADALGSLASQIIEGTSGDAVGAAVGQVLSGKRGDALRTLAGGIDQDALRTAADGALGMASEKAAGKNGGLFSQEYLKNILNSDTLVATITQHIEGIVEEKPDIAEAIVEKPHDASLAESIAGLPQGESLAETVATLPPNASLAETIASRPFGGTLE